MYKYTLFMAILFTQLFSQIKYAVGDTISIVHQNMEFSYCYPSDSIDVELPADTTFSFAENAGKIFMLERSAAW